MPARPQTIKALTQRNGRVPQVVDSEPEGGDTEDAPQRGRGTTYSHIQRIHSSDTSPHRLSLSCGLPQSYNSSPDSGSKRSRSPDDDLRLVKEPKRQSGGRPKQADYSAIVQEVIAVAIQLWCLKIFCDNAFPTVQQEAEWVTDVWKQACDKLQVQQPLDMDISRLVS